MLTFGGKVKLRRTQHRIVRLFAYSYISCSFLKPLYKEAVIFWYDFYNFRHHFYYITKVMALPLHKFITL